MIGGDEFGSKRAISRFAPSLGVSEVNYIFCLHLNQSFVIKTCHDFQTFYLYSSFHSLLKWFPGIPRADKPSLVDPYT